MNETNQHSAYDETEQILIRLQDHASHNQNDSQEADLLRERLVELYDELSIVEQKRSQRFSAELQMLNNTEISRQVSFSPRLRQRLRKKGIRIKRAVEKQIRRELALLYANHNWEGILEKLREMPSVMKPSELAYVRARAYVHLGRPEASILFYRASVEFDPKNQAIRTIYLNELTARREFGIAVPIAEEILRSPTTDFTLKVTAISAISRQNESPQNLHRVVELIKLILNDHNFVKQTIPEIVALAYSILGTAYERMGDIDSAINTYTDAIKIFVYDQDIFLIARGQLFSAKGEMTSAIDDFVASIQRKTNLIWPYAFLVHNSLHDLNSRHTAQEIIRLTTAGVKAVGPDRLRSHLYEWRAIAKSTLSYPSKDVISDFDEAIRIFGENNLARVNRQQYLEYVSGTSSPPWRLEQLDLHTPNERSLFDSNPGFDAALGHLDPMETVAA